MLIIYTSDDFMEKYANVKKSLNDVIDILLQSRPYFYSIIANGRAVFAFTFRSSVLDCLDYYHTTTVPTQELQWSLKKWELQIVLNTVERTLPIEQLVIECQFYGVISKCRMLCEKRKRAP